MIQLSSPITINIRSITLSSIDYNLIDNGSSVRATLKQIPVSFVLWDSTTSPTYSSMGDWTQAQADARAKEVLGADPSAKITSLIPSVYK